jgi:hypothetical protein
MAGRQQQRTSPAGELLPQLPGIGGAQQHPVHRLSRLSAAAPTDFPLDEAADVALDTIQSFLDKHGKPAEVFIVCFQPRVKFAFTQAMHGLG